MLRPSPVDDGPHPVGPEVHHSESVYLNAVDPTGPIGGFFRVGERPHQGRAEVTACLYLPDGDVLFSFARPEVGPVPTFQAAGLRWEVLEPFERWRLSYEGSALRLVDPGLLADPGRAHRESPRVTLAVDWQVQAAAPAVGGEPSQPQERPGEEFARGHYEQLVVVSGTVTVDGRDQPFAGAGLRDHSWGPRHWHAPWYYRWCTASGGPSFGFAATWWAHRDGRVLRSGFVWDDGQLVPLDDLQLTTSWREPELWQDHVTLRFTTPARTYQVEGQVLRCLPLRHRRSDAQGPTAEPGSEPTRITEGLTRWELDDGRVAFGLAEYLDQLDDGTPVGLSV